MDLRGPPGQGARPDRRKADLHLLELIALWVSYGQMSLAGLAYEGEPETFKVPFKKPKDGQLTVDQQAFNAVYGALRCLGERAYFLLKTTYKALRRYRGCPGRIGKITAAALVLLHIEHDRIT